MIREILLKGFLITFREIFFLGFGNIFCIFSFVKKYMQERFLKAFRNITKKVSLEKDCEKNFGNAL